MYERLSLGNNILCIFDDFIRTHPQKINPKKIQQHIIYKHPVVIRNFKIHKSKKNIQVNHTAKDVEHFGLVNDIHGVDNLVLLINTRSLLWSICQPFEQKIQCLLL